MKLILIFGPQAVGKMTVGHELEKITGIPLFHNHATIEIVHPLVSYGTNKGRELVRDIREQIFKAVSEGEGPGMIFTYLWDFESTFDEEYVSWLYSLFNDNGADVIFVELEADQKIRLERNKTEHRLYHKPSKRDTDFSERIILESEARCRHTSRGAEVAYDNYIRINNTNLSPEEVAESIATRFALK